MRQIGTAFTPRFHLMSDLRLPDKQVLAPKSDYLVQEIFSEKSFSATWTQLITKVGRSRMFCVRCPRLLSPD